MPRTAKPKKERKFSDIFAKYQTYDTSAGRGQPSEWRNTFYERMGADVYETILNDAKQSPEDVLGVAFNAVWGDVKAAYRKLVMKYHPDRILITGVTYEDAVAKMKIINAAYSKLSDRYGQ
jgi:hypothetical protein